MLNMNKISTLKVLSFSFFLFSFLSVSAKRVENKMQYESSISEQEQMIDEFVAIGEKKFRATQVFEWIYRKNVY